MKVELIERKAGATLNDITEKLDADSDLILTQELERDAFERVVDDVRLKATNLDGFFGTLFLSTLGTTRWIVTISEDARVLFKGEIDNTSIDFGLVQEWVEFDVFSFTKVFWDRAKTTKLLDPRGGTFIELSTEYTTVEDVLRRELGRGTTLARGQVWEDLFTEFDVDSTYKDRRIRGWTNSRDTEVTNFGRYRELNPNTKVEELLQAMSIYYNAEFFIDPETEKFTMRKRGSVLNDLKTDVDDIVLDDAPISVRWLDDRKYDYIHLALRITQTENVEIDSISLFQPTTGTGTGLKKGGDYSYRVTTIINNEELSAGEPVFIGLPLAATAPASFVWQVKLKIPVFAFEAASRRLYRTDSSGEEPYYLLKEFKENETTEFTDQLGDAFLILLPVLGDVVLEAVVGVWLRYDESAGTWDSLIVEKEGVENTPVGEIFDVTPELRFMEPTEKFAALVERGFRLSDQFFFFGAENSNDDNALQVYREQWIDVFRTKRKIVTSVKGLKFRIGDSMVSKNGLFPNDLTLNDKRMLIKRSSNNLTQERTTLELLTI